MSSIYRSLPPDREPPDDPDIFPIRRKRRGVFQASCDFCRWLGDLSFGRLSRRLATRREYREFVRRERLLNHDNMRIAAQEKTIEHLRMQLRLAQEALDQQIEINRRDRERVAWETAHFSRRVEQEAAIGKVMGGRGGGANAAAEQAVNELLRGL